ncbi:hypothetical protein SDRG_16761 [Saprolegnia diclina VS20]|uniref:Exportin-1/Importin-beta-like domain-containing protein n=1 Tax=Saprolegnia diclina (strain VS20) TaxID=1156394 RepID=T0PSY2_SAPDV|nr:hypothetical protein SDRG_16761 [Saprolegnia diclina VS20]EQC25351.1 hypothetical protein SDRG_16761 [Saprolegnia diclina VS20]|eukprot:XP_008621201.1 hypothetical protein SDRG_16761 [Saprolegnia diclina VS20]
MNVSPITIIMDALWTNAGSQPIADIVKANVHRTDVGEAGTRDWTDALLTDLVAQCDLVDHSASPTAIPNESQLGTLLSAAGLTIRYVTETGVFKAYLGAFEAVFLRVLRLPHWSKPYLGLKMVALRGCTRLMECFESTSASLAPVLLTWTHELLAQCALDMLSTQLLFRPTCELLNVLVQTQPSTASTLLTEVLPEILQLHTSVFVNSTDYQNDIVEWNTLANVVLDQLFPALPSARQLMTATASSTPAFGFAARVPAARWVAFLETLPLTADVASISTILPALYRLTVIEYAGDIANETFNRFLSHLLDSMRALPWDHPSQLELGHGLVESVRDLLIAGHLQQHALAPDAAVFATLEALVYKLPELAKDRLFKAVKAMLPDLRDATTEAFIALMYCMGSRFWDLQAAFVRDVAMKLADPLVFGDVLFVLQPTSDANHEPYERLVATTVAMLQKGLHQLHRYSKPMAQRLLGSVGHTVAGAGPFMAPYVADVAETLVDLYGTGSSSLQDLFVVALTHLYVACPFTDTDLVHGYCDILSSSVLDVKASGLESLAILLAKDASWVLGALPATFWTAFLETCTDALTSFPVFEEDVPLIVLQLQLCTQLLPHQTNMDVWNTNVLLPMVAHFHEIVRDEGLIEVQEASQRLLDALQRRSTV